MDSKRTSALLGFMLTFSLSVNAAVVHDDGAADLSGDPMSPTDLGALMPGSNSVVNGFVLAPSDVRDYFTFSVPTDHLLTAINLITYDDLDTPDANDGNRGFAALSLGATSEIPGGTTADSFLGGNHLDAVQVGTNLLFDLGLVGSGISGPLAAGDYTFLVQQTGPNSTGYELDLVVAPVPLPGALILLLSGCGLLPAARKKQA